MSENTVYNIGTCAFCGQEQSVDSCDTKEEADELATLSCDCPEAATAAKAANKEEEKKNTREKTLAAAKADIDELFGGGALERGEAALDTDVCDALHRLAEWVYDQKLRSVNIGITQGSKGKISVTDKGKLTIQRDDSSTLKREHK